MLARFAPTVKSGPGADFVGCRPDLRLGADSRGLARVQVVKEGVRWFERPSDKLLTVVGPAARSRSPGRLMEAVVRR